MMKPGLVYLLFISIILPGCLVSKNYNPDKKYPKELLREDYTILRNILEKKHPSLYWYTPKDSMDIYFNKGYQEINDSMTELQFGWKILAPVISKIHCGHTGFGMSKGWNKFIRNKRMPSFPLYLKAWNDTMVVAANLNRKDSILKKGMIITSINGVENKELINKMFSYLSEDGYSSNVKYQRISTSFPYFHRNIFGLYKNYSIGYINSTDKENKTSVHLFNAPGDSLKQIQSVPAAERKKITRKEKLQFIRFLNFDTEYNMAVMRLNSFSKGHQFKFYKRSFRTLRKNKTENLVIDIRNNGGGEINNFVNLARYIRSTPFKVADTAAAISKNLRPFSKYIRIGFFDRLGLILFTKKKSDNRYHFNYWEKNIKRPKRKNHFNGNVYVLTNGLTFSASSLLCNIVKGQPGVSLIGEETGGGWHGNSGIIIPEIVLPNTKLRVRIPWFRLVQYNHVPKTGSGVIPDVTVMPTVEAIKNNVDLKMKTVEEMIKTKNSKLNPGQK